MVVTFLTDLSVYLGSLLSQRVQNVIQTIYTCLLFNGVADNSAAPGENAQFSLKHKE